MGRSLRQHNYEKKEGIIVALVLLILLEIGILFLLINIKQYTYHKLTGIYTNPNLITVIVNKEEKKLLYEQSTIYLMDKKEKYKIKQDKGIILKKGKENYYEILLKIKTPKNKKRQDMIDLTIRKKKDNLFNIMKKVWEGDNYKKNSRRTVRND